MGLGFGETQASGGFRWVFGALCVGLVLYWFL